MIREACEWHEIPVDQYLDQRHRNWRLAEEFGDVMFDKRGAVFVHRVRAEHIVRALGAYSQTPAAGPSSPAPPELRPRVSAPTPPQMVETKAASRWRDIVGWLGILAGAAVFVTALAVPLDDAALLLASAIVVRGGRLILDVDS